MEAAKKIALNGLVMAKQIRSDRPAEVLTSENVIDSTLWENCIIVNCIIIFYNKSKFYNWKLFLNIFSMIVFILA